MQSRLCVVLSTVVRDHKNLTVPTNQELNFIPIIMGVTWCGSELGPSWPRSFPMASAYDTAHPVAGKVKW